MENQILSAKSIRTCQNALESAQQNVRQLLKMKEPKVPVLSTKMCQVVTTPRVHRPARTPLTASSAPGSARGTKETKSAAMDAPENAKARSPKREPWKNAGNTTWSSNSVSMKSVLESVWTQQKAESALQNVRNMQETQNAASVVTALLSARRNHYGASALLNARSLLVIQTAARQLVLRNVQTGGVKSAALEG